MHLIEKSSVSDAMHLIENVLVLYGCHADFRRSDASPARISVMFFLEADVSVIIIILKYPSTIVCEISRDIYFVPPKIGTDFAIYRQYPYQRL